MLRRKSINLFFKKAVVSFFALVGLLILLPTTISAEGKRAPGTRFVEGCILLFKQGNESVSAQVKRDAEGCIIEKENEVVAIKFYRSSDCTGAEQQPTWEDPESDFVYKSGIDGGCPEAVKVTKSSPTCVTLTLKSGREATICW